MSRVYSDSEKFYLEGERARQQGEPRRAGSAFLRVLELDEGHRCALLGLAWAEEELGNFAAATEAVRGALCLDPTDVEAGCQYARLRQKAQDLEGARALLRPLLDRSHDDPRILYRLASIAFQSGDRGQAETLARRVLGIDAECEDSHRLLRVISHATRLESVLAQGRAAEGLAS